MTMRDRIKEIIDKALDETGYAKALTECEKFPEDLVLKGHASEIQMLKKSMYGKPAILTVAKSPPGTEPSHVSRIREVVSEISARIEDNKRHAASLKNDEKWKTRDHKRNVLFFSISTALTLVNLVYTSCSRNELSTKLADLENKYTTMQQRLDKK